MRMRVRVLRARLCVMSSGRYGKLLDRFEIVEDVELGWRCTDVAGSMLDEPENEVIELHFVTCLLVLGPQAHDQSDAAYQKAAMEWWRERVGPAGCGWYAAWFCGWVRRQGWRRYHERAEST